MTAGRCLPVSRCDDEQIRTLYDRYARPIDALLGRATENSPYRKKAVAQLDLTPKSSVLDAACGTGSNFKIIESYLRNHGTLVGIDISSKSLETAARLVARQKWSNVQLLNASIGDYKPRTRFDAILCTFALEIAAEYESAIDNLFQLLKPNGRFVILGIKKSSTAPYRGFNPFVKRLLRKACIDLERNLPRYLESRTNVLNYEECFLGFYYVLSASPSKIPFTIRG
jgi:ubiquinone/menaquinone biosynthesis C-methylase UbiE